MHLAGQLLVSGRQRSAASDCAFAGCPTKRPPRPQKAVTTLIILIIKACYFGLPNQPAKGTIGQVADS